METKKCKRVISNAIAHLNGYALIVEKKTGYIPVAVKDTIKDLRKIKC